MYGLVTRDGLFEGHITSSHGRYVIERAARYFNSSQPFHSVIYKHDDVTDISKTGCNSDVLHQKLRLQQSHDKNVNMKSSESLKTTQKQKEIYKKYSSSMKGNFTNTKWVSGRRKRDVELSWQQAYDPNKRHRAGISQGYYQDRHKTTDPQKNTCTLYMQADHLFYRKFQSNVELVVEQLTQHVQGVNDIYNKIGEYTRK